MLTMQCVAWQKKFNATPRKGPVKSRSSTVVSLRKLRPEVFRGPEVLKKNIGSTLNIIVPWFFFICLHLRDALWIEEIIQVPVVINVLIKHIGGNFVTNCASVLIHMIKASKTAVYNHVICESSALKHRLTTAFHHEDWRPKLKTRNSIIPIRSRAT